LSKWGARAATVYTEAYAERYRAADNAADSRVEPAEWLRVCHRFAGRSTCWIWAAGRAAISALTAPPACRHRRIGPMLDRARHPVGGLTVP
jgi:hypothetical protein